MQKKQTFKEIAFENSISDLELGVILNGENKRRKKNKLKKDTPTTKKEVEDLYKKYFGVKLKDKV